MKNFAIPTREQVSPANQEIFDKLKGALGFVPNLYATIAYSSNALGTYLQLQNAKTSFTKKEKEVINLVVSQVNGCAYCQSAHTVVGKMNGLNDEQILEIRSGTAAFNKKLDALARTTKEVTETKGNPAPNVLEDFFAVGYTKESLVDLVLAIADKVVMNYLHNITQVTIDFPVAPALEEAQAA
jgi:AhpD family alkylhydroperoxidase